MFFRSLVLLLLAAVYCSALALNKDQLDLTKKSTGTPTTNAERLARGLAPAAPQALAKYVRTNPGGSRMRNAARQAGASPLPPSLPFEITDQDDFSRDFVLPFSAQIFGASSRVLRISADGWVGFPVVTPQGDSTIEPDTTSTRYTGLVLAFNYDLDSRRPGYSVSATADASGVSIRWNMYSYEYRTPPTSGTQDFTLTYLTAQPGVWTISYGAFSGFGDGRNARVLASTPNPANLITFSSRVAFRTPDDGLRVVLDTAASVVSSTRN